MTIAEVREKCKSFVGKAPRDILIFAVLIGASAASFGLGYLAGIDASAVSQTGQRELVSAVATSSDSVVVSKTGTRYYFAGCAGVDRISEVNKVWFVTASAAEAAGYTLAANCSGR